MADRVALSKEYDGIVVSILIEERADNESLRFTAAADEADGAGAHIRALLFDLKNVELTSALAADGDNVASALFSIDGVRSIGDHVSFDFDNRPHNDTPPFDAGVVFGMEGSEAENATSATCDVHLQGRALKLNDLDLDRIGVNVVSIPGGKTYPRLETLELNLRKDEQAPPPDGAVVPRGSTSEWVGSEDGTVESDGIEAGDIASSEQAFGPFAPVMFKGAPLEPLGHEATIYRDLDYDVVPSEDRDLTLGTLGRDPMGTGGTRPSDLIVDGRDAAHLRAKVSEKIMSDDPSLLRTIEARVATKSAATTTPGEQRSGADPDIGADFHLFIDGSGDEMLF